MEIFLPVKRLRCPQRSPKPQSLALSQFKKLKSTIPTINASTSLYLTNQFINFVTTSHYAYIYYYPKQIICSSRFLVVDNDILSKFLHAFQYFINPPNGDCTYPYYCNLRCFKCKSQKINTIFNLYTSNSHLALFWNVKKTKNLRN